MPGLPYYFVGFVMQRLNGYINGLSVRCMKKKTWTKDKIHFNIFVSLIIITQTDVICEQMYKWSIHKQWWPWWDATKCSPSVSALFIYTFVKQWSLKMSSVYSVCCLFETSLPDASVEANSVICEVWSWTTLFLEKDSVSFIRQQCKWIFVSIGVIYILNESWLGISNYVVSATSKAIDQPVHTRRLIRAFASRFHILGVLSYRLNFIWSF